MVMKRNVMRKNLRQTIIKSLGRYIAIVAIIALGAGMFVGLLTTKTDMIATAQKYTDEVNMFHLRLLNTYGWTASDVTAVAGMEGVVDAEGFVTLDVIGHFDDDDEDAVYRLHSIPETINEIVLQGGRMPESPNECLMDGAYVDASVLGATFVVSDENTEDTINSLAQQTFTVVGYVCSPLYMDVSRGSTSIGNGNLATYLYLPSDALTVDYFTEIDVTIEGNYSIYSSELDDAMKTMAEKLKPGVTILAQQRLEDVKAEISVEYYSGLAEYKEGLAEFEKARKEITEELTKALRELQSAQEELESNRKALAEAEAELIKAQDELNKNEKLLAESRKELEDGRAEAEQQFEIAYQELQAKETEVADGLKQVNNGLLQVNSAIAQIENGLAELESGMEDLDTAISIAQTTVTTLEAFLDSAPGNPLFTPGVIAQIESMLAEARTEYNGYVAQKKELNALQKEYTGQLEECKKQKDALLTTKNELTEASAAIAQGYDDLEKAKTETAEKFAAAEAELVAGEQQIAEGKAELETGWAEVNNGKAALEDAQIALDEGWAEYNAGKAESDAELASAEAELADAKVKLDDAKKIIDSIEPPEVYLLDRNTNVGYVAVNSNSDIVAGVSRVFPAFFLLVAALVCITTMTRMIEEERTQIGILKALGYNNNAIINKYLFYTGSAAVVGCGLGVVIGSIVFPKILWAAYGIILNVGSDLVLKLNWSLCIIVVAAYTAVSLLVTWYCCRRSLREVPAELMRPRSPVAGKKILLEHLPFWNKISFLNKVMFRNVFRYRQRLLMMMVGIGGCTALLLTGFGIRDSIVGIVGHQYDEISTYDIEVYFSEPQNQFDQMYFREDLRKDVENILFYHQTSGDLEFNDKTKDITLIAADEQLTDFIQMYENGKALPMPVNGEACVSIGVADAMGIHTGDTIIVRDADMRPLELKVIGVYVNYVNNFVITCPDTLTQQWGETPGYQMALISVGEQQDAHAAGAKISGMTDVLNVTVTQDSAKQIDSMLGALDLIVITIVVCAGLLAAIVLYNLTNISITERIREIATIKVLGFTAGESAMYVFKENLFLSAMGSVVGLGGGILLLKFVMSQIKVDLVWLTDRLEPWSFLWSVVLTMVCACIVDFLLYFKLEKINMAEALKSVE